MTPQNTDVSVKASIVVEAPVERAFSVFTEDIGSWWPAEHHILDGELAEMIFEPRVGGHVYDRAEDGTECRWGRVLVYEPPARVVFSWDISLQWQIEPDPTRTSEVEVRFVAEGPHETRVDLEHRKIEQHGEGWEQMRDAVASPDGWGLGLGRFVDRMHRGYSTRSWQERRAMYFFVRTNNPRPTFHLDMTEAERATMAAHGAYRTAKAHEGISVVFGPVADPEGVYGIGVFEVADEAEMRGLLGEDPANSLLTYRLTPMAGAVVGDVVRTSDRR